MQLVAVMTHADETVAPCDDAAQHFDAIRVYQVKDGRIDAAVFPFDPLAPDFNLHNALTLSHVTDVIGQHFEEGCYNKLRSAGINLWLEAPGFSARDSIAAFAAGHLTEAAIGAHALHGPEGRRVRHDRPHHVERRPRPDRAVSHPIKAGKLPF